MDRLHVYEGFSMAVSPCETGMYLTVDLTHRVCSKQTVREFMNEIEKDMRADAKRYNELKGREEATEDMIRKKVMEKQKNLLTKNYILAPYINKIWRIDDIDYGLNMNSTFKKRDGKEITYRDYYLNTYREKLQVVKDVRWGLLINEKKEKNKYDKDGNPIIKTTVLIPDFCYITGVTDEIKADSRQMQALADHMRKTPSQRMSTLNKIMKQIDMKEESKKIKKELENNFVLSLDPTKVTSRILEPFNIIFKDKKHIPKGEKKFFIGKQRCGIFGQ